MDFVWRFYGWLKLVSQMFFPSRWHNTAYVWLEAFGCLLALSSEWLVFFYMDDLRNMPVSNESGDLPFEMFSLLWIWVGFLSAYSFGSDLASSV